MNNLINPLITIGLTTYNRPDFLKESVQSVLNQTYKNFKLIIGNDYTESKITFESLGIDYDPRIEIINFEKNIGEVNNLNFLLSKAKSKWFSWLADDDLLNCCFLECLINGIEHNDTDLLAIYSEYSSGITPTDFFFQKPTKINFLELNPKRFVFEYVKRKFKIIGSGGLLNTEKLKMIGGFPNLNDSSGIYCDGLIPILLAEHGNIKIVNLPLVFLRTHNESLSASALTIEEYTSAEPSFLRNLSRVCLSLGNDKYKDKCIFQMVSWFTDNEFIVLFRIKLGEKPLSIKNKIKRLCSLLLYQFKVNYPRIRIFYWPVHTLNIIKFLVNFLFRLLFKQFQKK